MLAAFTETSYLRVGAPTPISHNQQHVLSTFAGVKKKERGRYGEFATKRYVLAIYDAMAKAIETGVPYETPELEPLVETEEWKAKQKVAEKKAREIEVEA